MIPKAPPSAANNPRTLFSHAAARFSRSGGTAAFFRSERFGAENAVRRREMT